MATRRRARAARPGRGAAGAARAALKFPGHGKEAQPGTLLKCAVGSIQRWRPLPLPPHPPPPRLAVRGAPATGPAAGLAGAGGGGATEPAPAAPPPLGSPAAARGLALPSRRAKAARGRGSEIAQRRGGDGYGAEERWWGGAESPGLGTLRSGSGQEEKPY